MIDSEPTTDNQAPDTITVRLTVRDLIACNAGDPAHQRVPFDGPAICGGLFRGDFQATDLLPPEYGGDFARIDPRIYDSQITATFTCGERGRAMTGLVFPTRPDVAVELYAAGDDGVRWIELWDQPHDRPDSPGNRWLCDVVVLDKNVSYSNGDQPDMRSNTPGVYMARRLGGYDPDDALTIEGQRQRAADQARERKEATDLDAIDQIAQDAGAYD